MAQCEAVGITPGRANLGKQCRRNAVTGSTFCVVHGGAKDTKTPEKMRHDRQGVHCSRTKKDGERCKNYAAPGTTVCRKHGANAPRTLNAARERLQQMVEPALVELNRIIAKSDTTDADRLRAINIVLDRTGYGPKSELGVQVEVKPWEETLQGIIRAAPANMQQYLPEIEAAAVEDDSDPWQEELDGLVEQMADPRVVGSADPPHRRREP